MTAGDFADGALQGLGVAFGQADVQDEAVGGPAFVEFFTAQLVDLSVQRIGALEAALDDAFGHRNDCRRRRGLQDLHRGAAIGPGKTAGAELDAAEESADHRDRAVQFEVLERGQDRPPGRAAASSGLSIGPQTPMKRLLRIVCSIVAMAVTRFIRPQGRRFRAGRPRRGRPGRGR